LRPRSQETWVKDEKDAYYIHHQNPPTREQPPHTTTEDPITPKAKRVCPASKAEDSPMNTDTDESDSEKKKNLGIPSFLFLGLITQSLDSIQRMDKLGKLLKEALVGKSS